jgi:hypothetical protein
MENIKPEHKPFFLDILDDQSSSYPNNTAWGWGHPVEFHELN